MLYLLTRKAESNEISRFVIRADNVEEAQDLANCWCGSEGRAWCMATCKILKKHGESEIIAAEFNVRGK